MDVKQNKFAVKGAPSGWNLFSTPAAISPHAVAKLPVYVYENGGSFSTV